MTDVMVPAEPQDLDALVLAGSDEHGYVAYIRCDAVDPEDPHRWLPLLGDDTAPVTWHMVCHRPVVTDEGECLEVPVPVIRLYRPGEETEQIGGHRVVVSTGRCTCHGQEFAPTELDRLRQQDGAP